MSPLPRNPDGTIAWSRVGSLVLRQEVEHAAPHGGLERVYGETLALFSHTGRNPEGPAMNTAAPHRSAVDAIRDEFDMLIEHHRAGIEQALRLADDVAGSHLAQVAIGLVHVPPVYLSALAEGLLQLEQHIAAGGDIAPLAGTVTAAPPAEPSGPLTSGVLA